MDERDSLIAALSDPDRRTGIVMDFDGVLSPIIDDPSASALLPGAAVTLERLAARLDLVALLSGRPVAFLAERIPLPGVVLLGSYGLERHHDGSTVTGPGVQEWLPRVATARDLLTEALGAVPGIHIEAKSVAVAVHWRNALDREAAALLVDDAVARAAERTGLAPEPGKLVQELRPPLPVNKGTALRQLIAEQRLDLVAYAGDDRGDLPAFAAAREAGGASLVVHGHETAPEVAAVPGVHFENPGEFVVWLDELSRTPDPAL
ncbi:trehalose-phosphatase [Kineosporia succinea]|uniref:Trehalose 6-phosphate phosphatase n=1 Tax=Kineosporia succinea TaxID=84632 RepID=A0ABT9PEF1_9ACTN|nr:trehalose-phosphatase [Kineosporia succinea]MDP9830866.1 trehalose 6-phosphate phosphatase [Kineosporia succinea]